jgi:hypothetical protein
MMQHQCQLRFLFTCDTDTSHYTALKMGMSEMGREKRVTTKFGEYQRRKNSTLQIQGVTNMHATTQNSGTCALQLLKKGKRI